MHHVQHVKAAQKPHRCDWCGKRIEVGQPYMRYRWHGDNPGTVREHPECYQAMQDLVAEEGEAIEFSPGDNPRGCNCGFSAGCSRCEQNKAAAASGAAGSQAATPAY